MEKRKTVLLVSSNPILLRTLTRMVRELGFHSQSTNSLALAQAALAQGAKPFAALVDFQLSDAPDGEGISALTAFNVPTVALTEHNDEETRERILQEAVVDYVCKSSPAAFDYAMKLLVRLDRNPAIKVLVADDSSSVRVYLRALLERHRYQVLEAGDGQQALDIIYREKDVRLVLADNEMPVIDGIQLTSELRRLPRLRRMAIIGISGKQDPTLTARFLKAGADDYLQKPFNHEEFFCRVTRTVEFIENLRALELAAFTDPLTGLYNRRHFFERANKSRGPHHLAILDIDHFKHVNDTYGHETGDQALNLVADLLHRHFPKELVARLGGDEFVVLSPEFSVATFAARLEHAQDDLSGLSIITEQGPVQITLSIGVAPQEEQQSLREAMRQADLRLYKAKQEGRNRISLD
jgi:diguanylate cyclase (GGDEF)-like protein